MEQVKYPFHSTSSCCEIHLLQLLVNRNPHATVDIFKALKRNHEEADVDRAIQIGSDISTRSDEQKQDDDHVVDNIHMSINDLLLSLPGINMHNHHKVIDNVENIAHLATLSVEQLTPLVGPVNAKKLFSFMHNTS